MMQVSLSSVGTVKKLDEELQVVFGEVYAPGYPDSQDDFMSPAEIRKMAHKFIAAGRVGQIDVQHDNRVSGAAIVESFIARKGDPDFLEGAWVIGVHVPDNALWTKVKSGELNGFSFEGLVQSRDAEIELDIPEFLVGKTDDRVGHDHQFEVNLDENGKFLGGRTKAAADGHWHEIKAGTVTEPGPDGHTHRFSYVEMLRNGTA